MPLISVILPTSRPGGMDVTFTGLNNQTFKDFELIWVDSIKKYREPLIRSKLSSANFPVVYVEPLDNPFPSSGFARCANTGISHASGDIVVMTQDYLYFPPDCLEKHANFHHTHPDLAYSAAHTYKQEPLMKEFPPWNETAYFSLDTTSRNQIPYTYVDDLRKGLYDGLMWSVFQDEITSDIRHLPPHPIHQFADLKMTRNDSFILDTSWIHLKNESVPREKILNINGFDEDFNGAHGWQDTEFGDRIEKFQNTRWYFDPTNPVYGFSPKDVLPRLRRNRPTLANKLLIEMKKSRGYADPVNDWSLRDYSNKLKNNL